MKKFVKKTCLVLYLLFASTIIYAQTFTEKWVSCFGGIEWDEAQGVTQSDSSYWIIGTTLSNDGDISFNHGNKDLWLLKLDMYGNLINEKTFGGAKWEFGFSDLKKLNDTVLYIFGGTNSVDGDVHTNQWPTSAGNLWIVKTDNKGQILWERVSGGQRGVGECDFTLTNDGGVLAMGFALADDGDVIDHHGFYDLWLIKLSDNGQKQWTLSLGGSGYDGGGGVIQTTDDGFLIAGNTDGSSGGNYDSTCNFHNSGSGYVDAWVVKLDTAHNIVWQQCYGGSNHDGCTNIIELPDGYIILGHTSSDDGDVTGFHISQDPNYNDIWVFKIDKAGNLLWQKCLGGSNDDYARNIFTTTDGGYMIVGSTRSSDGDVTGYHGTHGWSDDIWFAKIDSTGNLLWQYCYGGIYDEFIYRGVIQKSDWDYVLAIGTETPEWRCYFGPNLRPDFRIVELYDSTVGVSVTPVKKTEVKVYPNPANSVLNIELSNNPRANTTTIEMIDISGKQVLKYVPKNKTIHLDINQLKSGLYLVKIQTGTAITTQCIIKR